MPEDEVLAQAFFGQALSDLSAFQAALLAGAVASWQARAAARSMLRGGVGVADLDIIRDKSGNTTLSIGLYLGENVYTDVSTDTSGETEIHLRIDLTEDVVVKGAASIPAKPPSASSSKETTDRASVRGLNRVHAHINRLDLRIMVERLSRVFTPHQGCAPGRASTRAML